MQMTVGTGESKFGAPEGQYVAKFLGVKVLSDRPPMKGEDGKDMEPGLAWNFEVLEGPHKGKECDRVTGQKPTAKNSCGRMLGAVIDQIVKPGLNVDLDRYVGCVYQIVMEQKEKTEGTRVSINIPPRLKSGPPAGGPAAADDGSPPPPPARKPAGGRPDSFHVRTEQGVVRMNLAELSAHVTAAGGEPADVDVCPVGSKEWKTAADFGVQASIPF